MTRRIEIGCNGKLIRIRSEVDWYEAKWFSYDWIKTRDFNIDSFKCKRFIKKKKILLKIKKANVVFRKRRGNKTQTHGLDLIKTCQPIDLQRRFRGKRSTFWQRLSFFYSQRTASKINLFRIELMEMKTILTSILWCRITNGRWCPICASGSSYVTECPPVPGRPPPLASKWCPPRFCNDLHGQKFWTFRLFLQKRGKNKKLVKLNKTLEILTSYD